MMADDYRRNEERRNQQLALAIVVGMLLLGACAIGVHSLFGA